MRGVAFESGPTSDILFEAGRTCWMPVGTDCYAPEHPYYAVRPHAPLRSVPTPA